MMDHLGLLHALIDYALRTAPTSGVHMTRYDMYRRMHNILAPHDGKEKIGLSVSGSERMAEILGLRQAKMIRVDFPGLDVRSLPFDPCNFDFIVSDQVLERVRGDIPKLYRDLAAMLRPGGFMVHATPFLFEVHRAPVDCWRFAPDGLRWLAEQAGLVVDCCESWGNRLAWVYFALGYRGVPVPEDSAHPLNRLARYNEPDWPVMVWIVCHKPIDGRDGVK
jgi:SAM-dependent methyltransferase